MHFTIPEAALEEYASFFERQYNIASGDHTLFELPTVPRMRTKYFKPKHVGEVVKRMPGGKATGKSGFADDLYCRVPNTLSRPLCLSFNTVLTLGTVSSSRRSDLLVPIPKVPNTPGIHEHRPISLTEHLRKCFEHCLLTDLTDIIEPLCNGQCGFRKDRSTLDQCTPLNEQMIQHRMRTKG